MMRQSGGGEGVGLPLFLPLSVVLMSKEMVGIKSVLNWGLNLRSEKIKKYYRDLLVPTILNSRSLEMDAKRKRMKLILRRRENILFARHKKKYFIYSS